MCRTVSDAVQVLDAIVGIPAGGYMQFLKKDGLRGKRIGVLSGFFTTERNGEIQQTVYNKHLTTMRLPLKISLTSKSSIYEHEPNHFFT
jgi:amidase